MYKKICGNCETTSYSTSDNEIWLCPICQDDISNIEAKNIGTED